MSPCQIAFLTFSMALLPSIFESVSAEECLTTHQQLLEKKVSDRWKELHQKDNQPLSLTISTGQGNGLQFVGKKPDGSTWISGAMSICSSLGIKYQVTLDRIDKAPLLVSLKLRGMSDTIQPGSSHLKFGTGQHCGIHDPCIEFRLRLIPGCLFQTQWLGQQPLAYLSKISHPSFSLNDHYRFPGIGLSQRIKRIGDHRSSNLIEKCQLL